MSDNPREIPARHIEIQRQLDRFGRAAAMLRHGQEPAAELILEELAGLRLIVDCSRRLADLIEGGADRQKIEDEDALYKAFLWHLDRTQKSGRSVMTYVLDRWPVLREALDNVMLYYQPIAAHYELWEGGHAPDRPIDPRAGGEWLSAIDALEYQLDLSRGVVESEQRDQSTEPSGNTHATIPAATIEQLAGVIGGKTLPLCVLAEQRERLAVALDRWERFLGETCIVELAARRKDELAHQPEAEQTAKPAASVRARLIDFLEKNPEALGWSQRALADAIGCGPSSIANHSALLEQLRAGEKECRRPRSSKAE